MRGFPEPRDDSDVPEPGGGADDVSGGGGGNMIALTADMALKVAALVRGVVDLQKRASFY